jgi:hypothetical protein
MIWCDEDLDGGEEVMGGQVRGFYIRCSSLHCLVLVPATARVCAAGTG